jgi:uncharacterized protein with HEPN domain
MPLETRDRALLLDMRKAALEARSFVAKLSEAAFLKDLRTQRAVERALEIIGEAARGLSQEARETYPELPFRSIIGMRNLLAHEYGTVNPGQVWKTVKKSVPALLQALDSGPKFQ